MRAPSSSAFQSQLASQYNTSQAALNAQTSAYTANLAAANQAAANSVANQTAATNNSVNAATQAPVPLNTIATSPRGVLGNPSLSFAKLGG